MSTAGATIRPRVQIGIASALALLGLSPPLSTVAQGPPARAAPDGKAQGRDRKGSDDATLGLAELARARYTLSRRLYDDTLRTLKAPASGGGGHLVELFEVLHSWAEHAEQAIGDLGGPDAAHLDFLRAHATRMAEVTRKLRRLHGTSSGYAQRDTDRIALLSLEARSWVLKAEEAAGRAQTRGAGAGRDRPEGGNPAAPQVAPAGSAGEL
jgi:hypothetical protein